MRRVVESDLAVRDLVLMRGWCLCEIERVFEDGTLAIWDWPEAGDGHRSIDPHTVMPLTPRQTRFLRRGGRRRSRGVAN
jgi:hypothetical protein